MKTFTLLSKPGSDVDVDIAARSMSSETISVRLTPRFSYRSGSHQAHNAGDNNLPWGDEDESDDEGAFNLADVSSDVEIDPAELDGIGSDEVELEDDAYAPPSYPGSSRLTRI